MTGFNSKRKVALEKLDDDDAQGYIAQFDDALQKEYQQGYDAGKASQPKQEPVAELAGVAYVDDLDLWHFYPMRETDNFPDGTKFYTNPPKRQWVGLTENEIEAIEEKALTKQWAIRMALTAVKEKNT